MARTSAAVTSRTKSQITLALSNETPLHHDPERAWKRLAARVGNPAGDPHVPYQQLVKKLRG